MPHEVIMPALGMAQDTGLLVAWHKASGDKVAAGDVLFEVETDKATMEVEAAGDGFLTDVRASEGDDVPVGKTIALISDSPGAAPPDEAHDTPEEVVAAPDPVAVDGHEVIMPALGMAQDTGRIVAWAKAPGDAVATGDVLFEVETDKATMEVEAGHDGYLAAVLAQDGEDAPVGGVIAVISADKPDNPVSRSIADSGPAPAKKPDPAPPPKADPSHTEVIRESYASHTADSGTSTAPGGRILASPKARRLAAEKGLDLTRLADAGHPQPYHAADIDALAALPSPAAQSAATAAATQRIEARVKRKGFRAFIDWLADVGDPATPSDALAALAAGALRNATAKDIIRLRIERPGSAPETRDDADLARAVRTDGNAAPALILRDLTGSRLTAIDAGAAEAPVLTVAAQGSKTLITLTFSPGQMDADTAAQLADGFAARLEDPLRQLF